MKKFCVLMVSIAMLSLVSCKKEYTITVVSNNAEYGSVTGGGEYEKDATATIGAIPATGCSFTGWQDGNTDNPRQVKVTENATYTATFVQDASLVDAFVGEYDVEGNGTFNNIPVIGTYSIDFPAMDCTIVRIGNGNEVEVTLAGQSVQGYVNSAGLHIDPVVINQTISTYNVGVTITFPVIKAPVNGSTSWTSTLSASISGIAITGTADLTATKID